MSDSLTRRYEMGDRLGDGGMGSVWKAFDRASQRTVALKRALDTDPAQDAFQQEYWWMTRLSHPHLLEVYDFGRDDHGRPYYTMELVEGRALDSLFPLPIEEVARLVKQLGSALRTIHLEGLVHADIKPDNIRLNAEGGYKLFDFGLMCPVGQVVGVRGTLAYMAPEVIQQTRVDQRADIYSLGVLVFQALTGRLPFEKDSPQALLRAHLKEAPPRPSRFTPGAAGFWDRLIQRMLAKDPARRVQSAAELLEALGEHTDPDPPSLLCSTFVGRENEVEIFNAALTALLESETGGTLHVRGTKGSGKSRLLSEMAVRAQLAGARSLHIRVVPGQAPYEPLADLLRQVWEDLRERNLELLKLHTPGLQQILPEWGEQETAVPLEPQQAKIRLQSAVIALLLAVIQHQRVVLLWDDWHLVDGLAGDVVRALQRQLTGTGILFIFSETTETPGESLPEYMQTTPLRLQPLRAREATRLVAAMFGQAQIPKPLLTQVMELSGGIPQAIEDLLTHWVGSGAIGHAGGQWRLEPVAAERLVANQEELLAARLSGLDALARRTLEVIAIWDAPVERGLLRRVLDHATDVDFFAALKSLEIQRFLAPRGGVYVLEQQQLGKALQHQLAPEKLRNLHARVARVIEQKKPEIWVRALKTGPIQSELNLPWDSREGEFCVQLARHYEAAGDFTKAIPYTAAAAQYLLSLHASEAVRASAENGLALVSATARDAGIERGTLAQWCAVFHVLLGDSKRTGGALEAARAHYETAIESLDVQKTTWFYVRARIGLGLVELSQGQQTEARERLREALSDARILPHPSEELRCLAVLGRCCLQLGDMSRTRAVYEEGLARATDVTDAPHRAEFLANLGYLDITEPPVNDPLSIERGLSRLEEATELQTRFGDKLGLNDSYMLYGNALYLLGDLPRAEYAFMKNQGLCQDLGFHEEDVAWVNLSMVSLDRGEYQLACEYSQRASQLATREGGRFIGDLAAGFEARAWLGLGQWRRATDLLNTALQSQREADDTYGELYSLLGSIELYVFMGDLEQAEGALLLALDLQARLGSHDFVLPLQLARVRLAIARQQWNVAEIQCRETLARAEFRRSQVWEAAACVFMSQIAAAKNLMDEIDPWLSRAEGLAQRCQARVLQIGIHFERAAQAERERNTLTADARLVQAQEIATAVNTPEWQARCAFARARLHFPSPRAAGWLRDAYDHLKPLLQDQTPAERENFLRLPDRQAIAQRSFSPEVGPSPVATPSAEELSTGAQSHEPPQNLWFNELQRTVERLQKQLDFAQTVQLLADEEQILRLALQLFCDVSRLPRADILALEGVQLTSRATLKISAEAPEEDWTFYAEAVIPAAQSGELAYFPDIGETPGWGTGEPRAVLALPLGDERERWGVIFAIGEPSPATVLAPWDIEALRVLGDQLMSALRRAKLEAEWRAKTTRLEMLYTLSSKVTSTLVMSEVLDLVLKFSLEITQAERGIIFLADEMGDLRGEAARVGQAAADAVSTSESVSRSILRRVMDTREALCVEDAHDDDVFRHQKSIQDLNLRTVMAVPLAIHKRPLGILYVDSRVVVNAFTDRDLDLLRAIASHASVALENARLYDLATVDRLTKLYFRSYFEQRLQEELGRALRSDTDVSLLMMDIDHFKKFNDTYGHAVGDRVLAHVASLIRGNARQDIDVPCRYGGEEMVVLLPETDAEGALVFAERLRKAIDETPLHTEEHGGLHVTISIGTATCPRDASSGLQLMELADQALYHSKRSGRNRVTMFSSEVSV